MRIHPDDSPLKVYAFMQQHAKLLDAYAEQFEWSDNKARMAVVRQLINAWAAWGLKGRLSDVFIYAVEKHDRRP